MPPLRSGGHKTYRRIVSDMRDVNRPPQYLLRNLLQKKQHLERRGAVYPPGSGMVGPRYSSCWYCCLRKRQTPGGQTDHGSIVNVRFQRDVSLFQFARANFAVPRGTLTGHQALFHCGVAPQEVQDQGHF